MSKNDGGKAFPLYGLSQRNGQPIEQVFHGGMTLRDYFAAKAMESFVISASTNESVERQILEESSKTGVSEENIISGMAYIMADAMLRAREDQS